MLLLYHHVLRHYDIVNKIYIPLCFYFIADHLAEGHIDLHLHSTMLLLYPSAHPGRGAEACPFTFHYASTLSFGKMPPAAAGEYLHSTMLLLYRVPIREHIATTISFTFHYASTLSRIYFIGQDLHDHLHSTMLLLYPKMPFLYLNPAHIYIPLCFYFIHLHHIPGNGRCIFTFHYASTLSMLFGCRILGFLVFTFHYASTLSVN